MRNKSLLILFIFSTLIISSPLQANSVQYDYTDSSPAQISHSGPGRDTHFDADLYFPDASEGTYSNGIFEFDDYFNSNSITEFTITLAGHGQDSYSESIEIFLNIDGWDYITSHYVPRQYTSFTLTLDILHQQLLYNDVYVKNFDFDMSNFVGIDFFQVGYGCHFYHDSTTVHVAGSYSTRYLNL